MGVNKELKKYLAKIGCKGGKSTSARKTASSRANASKPPKPGKRPRGRPKKERG